MAYSTEFVIPRPASGDIIDVIIQDHRVMEALLRDVRNSSADREGARQAYSALLVAHSVAEEEEVYPALRRKTSDVGEHTDDVLRTVLGKDDAGIAALRESGALG